MSDDSQMPKSQQPKNRQVASDSANNDKDGCLHPKKTHIYRIIAALMILVIIIVAILVFWQELDSPVPDDMSTDELTEISSNIETPLPLLTEIMSANQTPTPETSLTEINLRSEIDSLFEDWNFTISSELMYYAEVQTEYMARLSLPQLTSDTICDKQFLEFRTDADLYPDDLIFIALSSIDYKLSISYVTTLLNLTLNNTQISAIGYHVPSADRYTYQHVVIVLATPERSPETRSCYTYIDLSD